MPTSTVTRTRRALTRMTMFSALLLVAAPALAGLHAIGHEFRPTVAERAGTNPCTASDGVTASLVFVCNESFPGWGCADQWDGTLYAEWRTPEGDLAAEPVLIAEGHYNYGIPHSCSRDGAIIVVFDGNTRVIDRDGPRGPDTPICDAGSCWGPFGVSASPDGFVIVWPQYRSGLVGRFFDETGKAVSASFLIDGPPSDVSYQPKGLLMPDGNVLIAWKTQNPAGVRAAMVGSDGAIVAAIPVSEFPYIELHSPLTLGIEGPDRVVIVWENPSEQAGSVARRVITNDNVPTTTTSTTSTTLDFGTVFLPAKELATPSVGDDTYHVEAPELVGDGSGHWLASWPDHVPTDNWPILGSKSSSSSDDARHWSAPQPFHVEDYPQAFVSSLAADEDGVTIDAWSRRDGAAILFRRSTDGGQSWSETGLISLAPYPSHDDEFHFEIRDLVVETGSDGSWLAAWTESIWAERPCPSEDEDCEDYVSETLLCAIRSSVSTDGGQTWSSARTIEDDLCWGDLRVAGDGNGSWLAVWSDTSGNDVIRGAYSTDNAEQWSPPRTLLSDIVLTPSTLAIGVDHDGNWLMAFSQYLFDPSLTWPADRYARVYLSRSRELSGDWSAPVGIAPWHDSLGGSDLYPSIAAGDDGEFAIAWSSQSAGSGLDADIVAAFSSDSGATWSAARTVDTEANGDARKDLSPRMVRAGSAWAVIWRALEASHNRTIRFARTRGNCGNGLQDLTEQCDDANLVEGDGCDSTCLLTGCGSQVVTDGEECDDGDLDDTDECVSCLTAFCGDGFVWSASEQCDDANGVETDACLGNCTLAMCGDGVVRPFLESCDDGELSGNNDGCLTDCTISSCGDGYLHLGEEHCDDGNLDNGDGCTRRCRLDPDCGFFTSAGLRVTATDALKVLKRAVGIAAHCPMVSCDMNHDGRVTAIDALWTLRSALGLFAEGCTLPGRLRLRMTSSEKLGALQVRISYLDAAGHVVANNDGSPACEVLAPSAQSALNWTAELGELRLGIVSLQGIQGPLDLLTCEYDPVSGPALNDFRVTVQDASGLDSQPVEPPPAVSLTAE